MNNPVKNSYKITIAITVDKICRYLVTVKTFDKTARHSRLTYVSKLYSARSCDINAYTNSWDPNPDPWASAKTTLRKCRSFRSIVRQFLEHFTAPKRVTIVNKNRCLNFIFDVEKNCPMLKVCYLSTLHLKIMRNTLIR